MPPQATYLWDDSSYRKSGKTCSSKPYDTEAGFLTNFSDNLKAALLSVARTTVKHSADGGGTEQVTDKIFLLSNTEVGLTNEGSAEGSIYALFNTASERQVKPTSQAVDDAWCTNSGFNATSNWYWWLRTPYASSSYGARRVYTDGSLNSDGAYFGRGGVRPAYVVSSSILVADTPDTDGAYTIVWNAPPTITTSSDDLGDRNAHFDFTFSFSDADGDSISAKVVLDSESEPLQEIASAVQGREYTQTISNQKLTSLENGSHTITITATDSYGNTSTKTVVFKKVSTTVTISGSDADLGTVWTPIDYKYTFADTDGGTITLKEYIDDELIRSVADAPQNVETTFDLSGWDSIEIEKSHTLKILCTASGGGEAERIITFTKLAEGLSFETRPMETDAPAEEILVKLNYDKTGNPTVKVEVTNATYNQSSMAGGVDDGEEESDAGIPWEDATEEVLAGKSHTFANTTFDNDRYGVAVKVTITKNEKTERVYVTGLGVAFN
jgi:hypothetical protein